MKENIFVARADERWTDSLVPFSTTGAETRLLSIKLALKDMSSVRFVKYVTSEFF